MKSILIIGASNAGKSTTMNEVCKKLNPSNVYKLNVARTNLENSQIEPSVIEQISNDTFIIKVQGKLILVVAGAPTEQNIKITTLLDVCAILNLEISFLLVSMRWFEKRVGFDTQNELKQRSEIVLIEKIHQIEGDNFKETIEWKNRIDKIVKLVESKI